MIEKGGNMKDWENNILGYVFNDRTLLKTALTHSSYANENKQKGREYNERLEFLGDSVLSLIISQYLFTHYKKLPEGDLTKVRSLIVCEKTLYETAKKIDLGKYLYLGKGEEAAQGRERMSILADAFEALIAALYLDGGFDCVKNIVLKLLEPMIELGAQGKLFNDYKTALQEVIQKNREESLQYVLLRESGPDHQKVFEVAVYLNSNIIGKGEGKSKKEAEQIAAREALILMGEV